MFASTLAALLSLPLLALAAPAIESRGGSRITYYDTSVGAGACGVWNANEDYTVALSTSDLAGWGGSPSNACGKKIDVWFGDAYIAATVQDECPTCASGQIDLSEGAFSALASKEQGQVYGSWSYQ